MGTFNIYFQASLAKDINQHFNKAHASIQETPLSQIGKLLRWHVSILPKELLHLFQKPRVVVVALTALALLAVQFTFYPVATALAVRSSFYWIAKWITLEQIHFGLYLASMSYVLGTGLLAFGRLSQDAVVQEIQARIAAQTCR
jgi:hypothetical protein